MGLAEFSAYVFVARQLRMPVDQAPAADRPLGAETNRPALAAALARAVDGAGMSAAGRSVHIDGTALAAAAARWQRLCDVCDGLLTLSSFVPSDAQDATSVRAAYADYAVTRWVFKAVYAIEIDRRPWDRPFPPSYDDSAKRGLAGSLVGTLRAVGFEPRDPAAFVKGSSAWNTLGDAGAALSRQVPL